MTRSLDASLPVSAGPWRTELVEVVRAVSGGLLFGVPLLYTMEVWWIGSHTEPGQMLVVLAMSTVPVFLLNLTAGFRSRSDVRLRDAAADTAEAVAIGLVVTALVLVMLREITLESPPVEALGKVLYEAMPFCLGIALATHLLRGGRIQPDDEESTGEDESSGKPDDRLGLPATVADLGATAVGATFICLSIAATDEVPMLAAAMSPEWLLVVVAASLAVSYAIVFVADFSKQQQRHAHQGIFQRPLSETVAAYLLSLVIAAVLLWFFQRGLTPWSDGLGRVIVLGFPATIGGAAGRLAI
ncbi:MAG: TIGR02587 family membrane protein [Actinomycetota bacterium]|nr:TIGR02587 family membrane protein [Actinomycetota bacterium]